MADSTYGLLGIVDDLPKLGPLLETGREVVGLGYDIFYRLHNEFPSDPELCTHTVFWKGFKTLQSVQILCRSGCGIDALALCGSLFENLVDLRYIQQDPIPRSERYVAFEQVDKYRQVKKLLRRADLSAQQKEFYQELLERLFQEVKDDLCRFPVNSCWSERGRNGKHRKVSLLDRAEAVGLGKEYEIAYYVLCAYKHTTPAGSEGFFARGGIVVTPNIKGVYRAARHSANYFLRMCSVFLGMVKLDLQNEVRVLAIKLNKADDQLLKEWPDLCD